MSGQAQLVIPVEQFEAGRTRLYLETRVKVARNETTAYVSVAVDHLYLLDSTQEQARDALFAALAAMEAELGATL